MRRTGDRAEPGRKGKTAGSGLGRRSTEGLVQCVVTGTDSRVSSRPGANLAGDSGWQSESDVVTTLALAGFRWQSCIERLLAAEAHTTGHQAGASASATTATSVMNPTSRTRMNLRIAPAAASEPTPN